MLTQECFWEVITLVGDVPLAPTLIQAALRSPWHFACVSGPNIGLVVSPLGRPQEFPAQIQIFTDRRGRERMSFLLDSEAAQILFARLLSSRGDAYARSIYIPPPEGCNSK